MSSAPFNPNADLLLAAVEKLAPLLDRIVFVGGCATGLLITDPAAAPVRPTIDVDAIVQIASYAEFTQLENQLRQLGWRESRAEDAPVCRWMQGNLIVDIMPTNPAILGFSNRWYGPAFEHAMSVHLNGYEFRLISAPYFLATKLEAFHGRGKNDHRLSPDLEDIVMIVDGRPELITEVEQSHSSLREFLRDRFSVLLADRDFIESLPGHLLPDQASQQRISIVLNRLRRIAPLST